MHAHHLALALVTATTLVAGCLLERGGLIPDPEGSGGSASSNVGGSGGSSSSMVGPGGSGGVGPGGAGGSGGGAVENCLDGIDNDGDMLADCSDPDCVAYTCVDSMPGAVAYLSQVPQAALCPAEAPASSYSGCSCGNCTVTPGTCSVTAAIYNDSGCTNLVGGPYTSPSGCINANGNRWTIATTTPNNDSSCSAPTAQVSASTRTACQAQTTGSCAAANQVCVPSPAGATGRCVLVDPGTACAAPYTVRVAVFEGNVTSCDCSCSDSGQGCAAPSVNVSGTSNSCTNAAPVATTASVCSPLGFCDSYSVTSVSGDVKCDMSATPSSAANERAFCCQP